MSAKNIVAPNADLHFNTQERICPICGKNFIPAPYHAWKVGCNAEDDLLDVYGNGKLVCTYSCMRKWEKSHGRRK